jgi:hypothetical protein
MGISIISYGKNSLDLRPTSVTISPRERIRVRKYCTYKIAFNVLELDLMMAETAATIVD